MSYTLSSRGSAQLLDPHPGPPTSAAFPVTVFLPWRRVLPGHGARRQRNWKLRLAPTSGDAMLMLQKDYLPNVQPGSSSPTTVAGGRALQKAANENYLLLPQSGQAAIPAGTYYVAVASEGQNPYSNVYGSNSCNYTLTSFGMLTYTNLGNVNAVRSCAPTTPGPARSTSSSLPSPTPRVRCGWIAKAAIRSAAE